MDQQSLQALLQELRGFDEAPPAPAQALLDTNTSEAVSGASDYTAWYEDYVKSADVSSSTATAATVASDFSSNGTSVQPPTTTTPRDAPVDLRKLTYAQALPIISALARDETFLDALQDLKSTQETFELSLLDERNQAKHDLEKQLKKARESATVSGVQYEVERISKLLNATMTKFDKGALLRWDALVRDQQARLEQLGVPCFYVLKNMDPVAQERQRRVMDTLSTLLSDV